MPKVRKACAHLHAMLRLHGLTLRPWVIMHWIMLSLHSQTRCLCVRNACLLGQAAAGRGPRRSRLLQLAAAVALLLAAVRGISWLRGTQSVDIRDISNGPLSVGGMGIDVASTSIRSSADRPAAAPARAAASSGLSMPAVDLAACMAEDNATSAAAAPMTTDMYLSGEPTRCASVNWSCRLWLELPDTWVLDVWQSMLNHDARELPSLTSVKQTAVAKAREAMPRPLQQLLLPDQTLTSLPPQAGPAAGAAERGTCSGGRHHRGCDLRRHPPVHAGGAVPAVGWALRRRRVCGETLDKWIYHLLQGFPVVALPTCHMVLLTERSCFCGQ